MSIQPSKISSETLETSFMFCFVFETLEAIFMSYVVCVHLGRMDLELSLRVGKPGSDLTHTCLAPRASMFTAYFWGSFCDSLLTLRQLTALEKIMCIASSIIIIPRQ